MAATHSPPGQVTFVTLYKSDIPEAARMAANMSSVTPNPFEALATALTTATNHMGNKQTLIRYLRNYYYKSNTDGDLIVNEMIDVFEGCETPSADMFITEHSDTELMVICVRHIVEDALTPDKIAAWMACQRSK